MKEEINQRLLELCQPLKEGKVKEAMIYSLLAPGKRLRPMLFLTVLKSYQLDYRSYMDVACAVEMIHTYSLIHDDLPGMDNDTLRRGKPTCHVQFDEATAILAGDGLLNEAVNIILNTNVTSNQKVALLKILYQAAGINGMIFGQSLDLKFEHQKANQQELNMIHHHKTGDLISAALMMGACIANEADQKIWQEIGYKIGLAFQIQDDVLDVVGNCEILGKEVGSDIENHKSTYVTLMGVEQSSQEVNKLFKEAMELIYKLRINHGLILEIIEKLQKRVK